MSQDNSTLDANPIVYAGLRRRTAGSGINASKLAICMDRLVLCITYFSQQFSFALIAIATTGLTCAYLIIICSYNELFHSSAGPSRWGKWLLVSNDFTYWLNAPFKRTPLPIIVLCICKAKRLVWKCCYLLSLVVNKQSQLASFANVSLITLHSPDVLTTNTAKRIFFSLIVLTPRVICMTLVILRFSFKHDLR